MFQRTMQMMLMNSNFVMGMLKQTTIANFSKCIWSDWTLNPFERCFAFDSQNQILLCVSRTRTYFGHITTCVTYILATTRTFFVIRFKIMVTYEQKAKKMTNVVVVNNVRRFYFSNFNELSKYILQWKYVESAWVLTRF